MLIIISVGDLEAQDVAEALLDYVPFEHGFFWFGLSVMKGSHLACRTIEVIPPEE